MSKAKLYYADADPQEINDLEASNLNVTGIVTTSNLNVTGTITNFNSTNLVGAALSISGISTFTNGPIFIGAATSTGTASQRLQVTGGAYVSDSVGIGTTNPQTKLQINGVLGFGTFISPEEGYTSTNIRIGDNTTGASITDGYDNIFMGIGAGNSTTSGNYNNFFGQQAGHNNTTGGDNTFFGRVAGFYNTTGGHNNFLGSAAGLANTTGSFNNFFGRQAGFCNTSGSNNNFFGNSAGSNNTTGSYNVIIGPNRTGTPIFNGSNQLVIGAGSTDWIIGNSSYNVGIGTTNPTEKLHVVGNTIISQDLKFNSGYGSAETAYGVRAWVQTGDTTTINGSANISSVSEPLTTQKQINFTTAMPDANYAVCVTADDTGSSGNAGQLYGTIITNTTGSVTAQFSDDATLNTVGNTYWIVVR